MTYKAMIIGCGKIAGYYDRTDNEYVYSHAHAYSNNPFCEIDCYVDVDMRKAKILASKYYNNAHLENDYIYALERYKPDVVSVCTPDDTHYGIVKAILENDKSPKVIFLEKPACKNIEELKFLISLASKKGTEVIVNHTRRFDSKHRYIRDLITQNFFGELVRGDVFYYSGWEHNGIHVVDTLNFIFNSEVIIKEIYREKKSPYFNDPTFDILLSIENKDAEIYIHSFDEKYYQLFEFDLKFEKARLRIEDFGDRIIYERKKINSMKENVLVMDKIHFPELNSTPMQNAIDLIFKALIKEDMSLFNGYRLVDIENTMKVIWVGKNAYKNKS